MTPFMSAIGGHDYDVLAGRLAGVDSAEKIGSAARVRRVKRRIIMRMVRFWRST